MNTTPDGSCEPCISPGEELQADAWRRALLGERGELDAAAEPLVLVHHGRGPGRTDLPGQVTALPSSDRVTARVEIFSAKTRVAPETRSESA